MAQSCSSFQADQQKKMDIFMDISFWDIIPIDCRHHVYRRGNPGEGGGVGLKYIGHQYKHLHRGFLIQGQT